LRIVELYSHLNGREHILVHKPTLWEEIERVIGSVDATRCRTKISKEQRTAGQSFYSPVDMNKAFSAELTIRGWHASRTSYWVTSDYRLIRKTMQLPSDEQRQAITSAGKNPITSYNQTDFVKDRIAVEVQFGKYAFVAYDLFVKHMAFYVSDVIDVGVEILPMKELQSQMSSGVAYYEGELYNVIRQGRGVPAVPLVIIGVAP
jgi:Restriction endonuclease BglII